ncbi:MAG: hypothetical protein RQ733_01760 [Methyloprofundus sp.]|nr:hypothetical protein [Methyloprofundus sp.]MDT8424683.1 hypothetical protein [Methyloprofundus sp.]
MMSTTRATHILNSYGGDPDSWPAQERQALLQEIASNSELLHLQQQAQQFDRQLQSINEYSESLISRADTQRLANKIRSQINKTPVHKQDKKVAWLDPFLQAMNHYQTQMITASILVIICTVGFVKFNETLLIKTTPAVILANVDSEVWLMEQVIESQDDEVFFSLTEADLLDDDFESEFL